MRNESPVTEFGLTSQAAAQRLLSDGPNQLSAAQRRTGWRILLEVVREPMFQLLIAAGIIYLILGDAGEAMMLLAFVVLTVVITVYQERRTENVLEKLRDLTSPRALVVRDGAQVRIAGADVVVGDVLILSEGDRVPADAQVLSANDLQTDESLLTGESVPVGKISLSHENDLLLVYSGTLVVRGQGVARVTATGARCEIGKIGVSLAEIQDEATPLSRQTRKLVRMFSVLGLTLSIFVVLELGLLRGDWMTGLLSGITLAMSMLPQEFILILTVFMAMGAWRISRHRVLTRRSAAIETLGSATVLCTDKTGTLTLNRMRIAALHVASQTWDANEDSLPEDFHALLEFGILASERDPFDPMEQAFVVLGDKHLTGTEHLHAQWLLAFEYGLHPDMLAMSHVWTAEESSTYVIACKGAPEAVTDLCHLDATQRRDISETVDRMATKGFRMLAVARARYQGVEQPANQHDFDFEFLGLVALEDPLRAGVREAVQQCQTAGIQVVMITGDYPATALAIAKRADIAQDTDTLGNVITGEQLDQLDDQALAARLRNTAVFARIKPAQKLRIVTAFKNHGDIVAMTGDGVNDAPALKAAHIGIAMGSRGTDVAREASAIVLLDDDFGSIVKAIRQGRQIFENLRKAMAFVLAVHVPIAGLALLPILLGWPALLYPVHIAFLELVMDPVCSIVYEAEPAEDDIMECPPRAPEAPLFSPGFLAWSLAQGLTILALLIGLAFMLARTGPAEDDLRSVVFVALVIANFGLVLVNRSLRTSLVASLLRPNRSLWFMTILTGILLAAALWIQPVREVFRFAVMTPGQYLIALAVGMSAMVLLSVIRLVRPNDLRPLGQAGSGLASSARK